MNCPVRMAVNWGRRRLGVLFADAVCVTAKVARTPASDERNEEKRILVFEAEAGYWTRCEVLGCECSPSPSFIVVLQLTIGNLPG